MREVGEGVRVLALRTPTLPPAEHTNCYILGEKELTIVDPASPWEDEQHHLVRELERLHGARVARIVLTHHHGDHVGGVHALQDAVGPVPVIAHPANREWLDLKIDEPLLPGTVQWDGVPLDVFHTPGHAPGHIVLSPPSREWAVVGDMVASIGTIAIGPYDGNLGQYLASLEAMLKQEFGRMLPAHGDPIDAVEAVLSMYIAHRHARTEQFLAALKAGGEQSPEEIAATVYVGLPVAVLGLASGQVLSHLMWMAEHGLAKRSGERWLAV